MRRLGLFVLPLVAAPFAHGCAERGANVGFGILAPQGILDEATQVTLTVFDAEGHACTPEGGFDSLPAEPEKIQTFELSPCSDGDGWCASVQLEKNGRDRIFAIVATGNGVTLGQGCTVAKVDQDPTQVDVTILRFIEPACCGDGKVQVGEQCDPGGDASCGGVAADEVCAADCTAQEILLSVDNDGPPTALNAPPLSKSDLSMAFVPGGPTTTNALRAVFGNASAAAVGGEDVVVRYLSADLHTIETPLPLAGQLMMPLLCTDVTADGAVRRQREASLAPLADGSLVAFASDQAVGGTYRVYASLLGVAGCADASPVAVSSTDISSPMPGAIQTAASGDAASALVVWQSGARVVGRVVDASLTLAPAAGELEIATVGSAPRVAKAGSRWLVVYQGSAAGDGDAVVLRTVDASGALGAEIGVNAVTSGPQDQPDVAAFADGSAVVVWRSGGDVFFQRFDANLQPVAGDQDAPLNTVTSGAQGSPAVAASPAAAGFFAVAWEDSDAGTISARFLGKDKGFLFNSVSGQNDAFLASSPAVSGLRRRPAVAVGGAGFVAIGWQDDSVEHPGVYVRRFPLP